MTTNKGLIERLRSVAGFDHLPRTDLAVLAADALEASDARYESAEHDRLFWRRLARAMRKRAMRAEAERDAALAAVERVRAVADQWNGTPDYQPSEYDKGRVDQRHDMTEQLLAALDGAPEPEWEYRYAEMLDGEIYTYGREEACFSTFQAASDARVEVADFVVRRRKAGPWLPVEGESNA